MNIAGLLTTYNFEFEELPDNLKCVKCKLVLKDACQVPCGCTFCRVCINDIIVKGGEFCSGISNECPTSPLSRIESDYRANNNVSKLRAKCPYNGCVFKFHLVNMKEHISVCQKRNVECPFREFGCPQNTLIAEQLNEHLLQENGRHSEILIEMIANIDRKMQCSNREIEMLKQRDENNMRMRTNESNTNENESDQKYIDSLEQKEESKNRMYEMLKAELEVKDEQIRTLSNQVIHVENQNESMKKAIKSIKRENADLVERMRIMSEKIDREIKERTESSTLNGVRMIEHVDKEILAVTRKIGSNKDELCTKIESLRNDIQSINQGTQLMKGDIGRMKSNVQSIQALVGQVDVNIEWLINEDITKSWDKGYKTNKYFHGERRPYTYQLASWNGGGELWLYLRIYSGQLDGQLAWPFEGRVVITVADKNRRDACRSISKQCKIEKPSSSVCTVSDYFKFRHSDLIASKLDLDRGICVSCAIVSCAGR